MVLLRRGFGWFCEELLVDVSWWGILAGVVGRFVHVVLAGSYGLFVGIRGFGSGFLHPVNGHQVEFI